MDLGIALTIVPIIVGLVVLDLRFGLLQPYEVSTALVLGVTISVGYAVAAQVPGGEMLAKAVTRGLSVGLTSAGLIASNSSPGRVGVMVNSRA